MTEVDIVTKQMEDMLEEQVKIQNEARYMITDDGRC